MKQFNLAVLEKQVWRLMHNTYSLYYKVFSAKYFSNDQVLDAKLGCIGELGLIARYICMAMYGGETEKINFTSTYADGIATPIRCHEFMISDEPQWDEQRACSRWRSSSVMEWFEDAVNLMGVEHFTCFIVLIWDIRNWRNKIIHDDVLQPASVVVANAATLQVDFSLVNVHINSVQALVLLSRWCPLTADRTKINVDGSYSSSSQATSIGVVARDCDGFVRAGVAMKLSGPYNMTTTTAFAFREGIQLALIYDWVDALVKVKQLTL
ncbi:hypothetical protein GQ457_13G000160 [Hibiscus cannabinus]